MTDILSTPIHQNFIGGSWSGSSSGETYEKRNPWRPSVVTGSYAASTAEDAGSAVEAARSSFPGWAALPAPARAAFFFRAADAIEARVEQIAQDMTAEMGKPLREARMEAARAAAILRYSAGEAYRPAGEVYEPSVANQTLYTRRRPLGVVGLITPWNFPIAIPVWKLAPALIYGNTVVLKLGYEAPRTGLHIAQCFAEAGLPDGVLNVLTGSGAKAGAELVTNRHVRALSFTGSVAVGHAVRNEATVRNCRVQLELGGHNPFVVMADAELDRAAEAAFVGAFWSAGQKCTATRRILVQDTVYDTFREKLLSRIAAARVGDPSNPDTEVGPVVAVGPFEEIMEAIERGKKEGGTVAAGGTRADAEGYLIAPTVFENVADDAFLSCQEVFGPVTSLYRFSTLDEALERANAVDFGLSASIFTRDLHTTQRFANELQAGILHVNSQTAGADVHVPFGGLKSSAWGPHEQGRAAMEFYTETVTVYQDARLPERVLVTGVLGCLGAWVARCVLEDGDAVVGYDLGDNRSRLDLVLGKHAVDTEIVHGDITDLTSVERALDEHGITRVVHLAALQVPFVRANPPLGMSVNVAGTVNVFDAVSRRLERIPSVAYASSAAVYNPSDPSPAPEAGGTSPATLYGVSKLANEGIARVYHSEAGVPSIGLRPYVVYGPGRDQGMTSGPTSAMLAAIRGEPAHIGFSGTAQFDYVADVARATVTAAHTANGTAGVYNTPGAFADVADVVACIEAAVPGAEITWSGDRLPFPAALEAVGFDRDIGPFPRTSLADGVSATVAHFRRL